jgi:hypothetical protein
MGTAGKQGYKRFASLMKRASGGLARLWTSDRVIAIATVVIMATTYLQWKVIDGQLQEMKAEKRPWVGFSSDISLDQFSADNSGLRVKLSYRIKNFGDTPASNTLVWMSGLIPDESGDAYHIVDTKLAKTCASAEHFMYYHSGDLLLPSVEQPKEQSLSEEGTGLGKIVVPGCIVYRDVAGTAHHTRFCYSVDLAANPRPKVFATCYLQSAD